MNRIVTVAIPFKELPVAGPYDSNTGRGNFDTSRAPIDRVIIHTMVGTVAGAAARFDDPTSNVSAHYGIGLDGSLYHWLEETFTGYHSGNYPMNQRSIGIEHEDNGDYNGPRTDALYTTSAKLVHDICKFYEIPIDRDHIKRHNEVSDRPTACPDALDIDRIVREAKALDIDPIAQCNLDRDINWNCFTKLCDTLGIVADPNNKSGTTDKAVQMIKDLQNRPTIVVNTPPPPSGTTIQVPIQSSTQNSPSNQSNDVQSVNNTTSPNVFLNWLEGLFTSIFGKKG